MRHSDPPLMRAMILKSEVDEFVERFEHAGGGIMMVSGRVRTALAILAAGVWMNACWSARNGLILKTRWMEHHAGNRHP